MAYWKYFRNGAFSINLFKTSSVDEYRRLAIIRAKEVDAISKSTGESPERVLKKTHLFHRLGLGCMFLACCASYGVTLYVVETNRPVWIAVITAALPGIAIAVGSVLKAKYERQDMESLTEPA